MQTLFNILKSDKLQTTSNNNASSVIVHAAVSRLMFDVVCNLSDFRILNSVCILCASFCHKKFREIKSTYIIVIVFYDKFQGPSIESLCCLSIVQRFLHRGRSMFEVMPVMGSRW